MSDKKFNSLLDEIYEFANEQDQMNPKRIENRGRNIISSACNLLQSVRDEYGEESEVELEKKLLLAIKRRDESKFINKLRNTLENN